MSPLRRTLNQGLFGATLGFFMGCAAVALFGSAASRFQEVMHLSPIMVGLLAATPALSGSLPRISPISTVTFAAHILSPGRMAA